MNWLTPVSSAGVALMVMRWWRRRRQERALEQQLVAANGQSLGSANHLSPGLSRVARQAQTLRLVLETPLRRVRSPLLSESPWRRRERCNEYDNMLTDVRRAMWEWLRDVDRLDDADRRILGELGLSLRPFRTFLFFRIDRTEDPWEQVVWAEAPDVDRIHREFVRTILELKRFEQALAQTPLDPYRAVG